MTNTTKIPKLRFKEFSGEWKETKLGEIAKFSKGKGLAKADIVEKGENECIRYGELYTNYGETIENIKSYTNLNKEEYVTSEKNDIIIPASGETQIDIATASCVLKNGVILGGDLNIIKTDNNGVFFSYYLNNKKKIDIARLSQGISVVHLYSSQLQTLNLNIPNIEEQDKIVSFLSSVDEKIENIKEKKRTLEEYKKGVMQKIFKKEIRFNDENLEEFEEWKEGNIGKYIEEYNKKTTDNNQYRILSSSMGGIQFQDEYFNKQTASKDNIGYKIVPKGYFTYRSMSDTGSFTFNIQNIIEVGIVSPAYPVFKTNENLSADFLYYYLNNSSKIKRFILTLKEGGTRYALSYSKFLKLKIQLPEKQEQEKIALFLAGIEEKIEEVSILLTDAEKFKKGLLQQMFI